jgi:hypothetical protein
LRVFTADAVVVVATSIVAGAESRAGAPRSTFVNNSSNKSSDRLRSSPSRLARRLRPPGDFSADDSSHTGATGTESLPRSPFAPTAFDFPLAPPPTPTNSLSLNHTPNPSSASFSPPPATVPAPNANNRSIAALSPCRALPFASVVVVAVAVVVVVVVPLGAPYVTRSRCDVSTSASTVTRRPPRARFFPLISLPSLVERSRVVVGVVGVVVVSSRRPVVAPRVASSSRVVARAALSTRRDDDARVARRALARSRASARARRDAPRRRATPRLSSRALNSTVRDPRRVLKYVTTRSRRRDDDRPFATQEESLNT